MWAGLLLAAVFAMHGLQCMAAPDTGHAAMAAAESGMPPAAAVGAALSVQSSAHQASAASLLSGAVTTGWADAGSTQSVAVGAATVCVAVLLSGLGLLGAALLLLVRAGRGARPPTLHVESTRATGWARPPRPPDLFTLCLLRT